MVEFSELVNAAYSQDEMATDERTVGQNIAAWRKRRGLRWQRELAAKLGVYPSEVSRVEGLRKTPTPREIQKYAEALECTPADLLAGVVTEYDRMRGSTTPTAPPPPAAPKPDKQTEKLLRLWDGLSPSYREMALRWLADIAKIRRR